MDPEVAELASVAGQTLVTLMATDAWTKTRDGTVALWRRVRPEQAEAIGNELAASRSDLLTAQAAGDRQSEAELRAEWQGRMRRLLAADPEVIADLRQLLDELAPTQGAPAGQIGAVHMNARASGKGRVYQSGRDQHIVER